MHRTRWLAACSVVVIGASGAAVWRLQQRGPRRPSVSAAIDRFHQATTSSVPDGPWEPAPGVYVYKASGTESLSFLGTHQSQGPLEPGTITLLPHDCWRLRIDFNSFHSQTWTRCGAHGTLSEVAGTTVQKFDFMAFSTTEHTTVQCPTPFVLVGLALRPGTTSHLRCEQRSSTTKTVAQQDGTVTFLGRDSVVVAGHKVPALHAREHLRLSGQQTGDIRIDLWFASANALPLAERHTIRVVSPAPSPIKHVTYTENGHWTITSLAPRT